MSYNDRYTITTDPAWTIDRYPQLHLEPTDDGAIIVTTTNPGQANIQFRWTLNIVEPRTWTDVADTVPITVTGRIIAANDAPEWQPA
ncbi:hypothetical protein [Dactylosporangium sp. NPDC051484]|uniref:hypothetical protein n=1 Tax=Dactylosporangium sp. NPDC051484 TaxID=3154942 RepID=UPI00344DEF5A